MQQLILNLQPTPIPALANFIVGQNRELLTKLTRWNHPETDFLLYLWGEKGLGKTHLLRAVGNVYIDGQNEPEKLQQFSEENAPLCIGVDHVDVLNAEAQMALFNLFNRQKAAGGKLLVAATLPPKNLSLREDVRTRLGSGLIYRMEDLLEDEKREALWAEIKARQMPFSSEMMDYFLSRAPRNLGDLMRLIAQIDHDSLAQKRPITLPLLRQLLTKENT